MKLRAACLLAGLLALVTMDRAKADGTEGLAPPSIPIATGTGIAAGGRGLITQPGMFTVTVPAGVTVKQVLIYWEGFMKGNVPGDSTIRVSNGGPPIIVNGTLIGGPSYFFNFAPNEAYASTYRADITGLGLITSGVNNMVVDGLDFTFADGNPLQFANNGAGIFVIYDDGTTPAQIDVRDGNDLAYFDFPAPRRDTIPQTFTFAPALADRVSRLDMFFASVAGETSTGGPQRPNVIEVTVGAVTTVYNNLLDSFAGEEWDYVSLPITVPAGVTTVKVQAFSRDDLGLNAQPASLDWVSAFFVIDISAHIGDLVFNDLNANGIQDGGGEVGVNGVTVQLFTCGANTLMGTTVTAGGGLYGFDVAPGDYYVKFSNLPPGFGFSPSTPSNASDPIDSDANPATGQTACTTIVGGENDPTWDAGIFLQDTARIGDLVFNDLNANGNQDGGGEVGINGVTVQLFNCVGDVLTGTTVTAGGGLYLFTVPPGNYYVKFSNLPAGFVFSPSTLSAASDPDDSDANPATGVADCTTLVAGETDLTWDAGIYQPAKIGDTVFNDLNANGNQDGGVELGVDGVTVELYKCVGDVFVGTTVTASGGLYLFTVPPGDYYVKFSNLPAGFVFSPSTPGGASDPIDSDANPATGKTDCTTLVSGENDVTWDAGIFQPAKIGDLVFNDLNANGIQDGGSETGVDGVTVQLFNCVGDVLTGTTVTAGGGLYLFTVPPGNYYVKFSNLPVGFVFSPSTPGGASDPTDSDANPITGVADCTILVAGETDTTWDAGIYQPAKIGDLVFNDLNANGIQDGGSEVGINGVTVQLFTCVGDVLSGTMVTASGGLYLFTVPPGNYYVKFSNLPAGFVFSPSTPGSASDPTDSDANPITGVADCTTLVAGETDTTWDAGIYQPAKIGDLVFHDLNGNGNQDGGGEVGIPGITVQLYNCVGDVLVSTTVTAAGGTYMFTVPPGNYYVKFSNLPAGFVFSPSTPGGASDPTDSDANPATGKTDCTTLDPGETDLTWDAGINNLVPPTPCIEITKVASTSFAQAGVPVTYTYTVTNCGAIALTGVSVKDDNGTPNYPGDDFIVGTIPSLPPGGTVSFTKTLIPTVAMCMDINGVKTVVGTLSIEFLGNGDIKVVYLQSRNVNDNTYGTGVIGWPGNHTFSQLLSSDKLEFKAFNTGGSLILHAEVDYVSTASTAQYPSGYGTLGVTGGDGNVIAGSSATVASVVTTITRALNNSPFIYSVNSPLPEGSVPTWEYVNGYEFVLKGSAFAPSGFGRIEFPAIHNSPSKLGFNVTIPTPCDSCVTNVAVVTAMAMSTPVTDSDDAIVCIGTQVPPAAIGNFVWNDVNNNGRQDAGETGVDGVKVELFTCVGNVLVGTTTTAGGGLYGFNVTPGDYYVKFSNLPAGFTFSPKNAAIATAATDSDADVVTGVTVCTTLTAGENDTTWDAGINQPVTPGQCLQLTKSANPTTVAPFQPVTYSYLVCNCGTTPLNNVVITDDNGTPNLPGDDFTVGTIPTLGAGACQTLTAQVIPVISTIFVVDGSPVPAGAIIVVTSLPNGDIKATYLQDFGVNDNTYGTGAIGWPSGHTFGNLTGSDKLEFRFFAKDGTIPLDLYIDTISAASSVVVPGTGQVISYPAGYGTMGPFGGDGSMVAGNPNNVVTFSTSISDNLNKPANLPNKAALIVNSPTSLVGGNVVVDPVKAPGGWEHINSFTVVVKGSTFAAGGGFGSVSVPDQHNSPSKGPKGTVTIVNSMVTNTATANSGAMTVTSKAVVAIVATTTPGGGGPLPSPWQTADVGTVKVAGSASFSGSTFTVLGAGKEINGSKDSFRYVYQQANGDCAIVAKVLSIQKTDNESGAGVMIRETLTAGSKHATLLVTANKGLQFKRRTSTGGSTSKTTVSGITAPYWVRIIRSGNTFTADRSTDGVTWTSVGSVNITMGANVYIGLDVTSKSENKLTTATFDNVTATP